MKSTSRRFLGLTMVVVPFLYILSCSAEAQVIPDQKTIDKQATAVVEGLDIRLARKRLEIAKSDLELAISQNRQIANENNKVFIKRLETQVAFAQDGLASALKGELMDAHKLHINQLEASVDLARSQLEWIKEINKTIPGMYNAEQLKRLRLEVELKEIELEGANASKVTRTPIDHLQWQIDQIQSEVMFMRLQLERNRSAR